MTRKGFVPDSQVSIKARKRKLRTSRPHNFIDESGQRYGRLIVINSDGYWKDTNEITWCCKCDCGNVISGVRGAYLRSHETSSCGCRKKELLAKKNKERTNQEKDKYLALAKKLRQEGFSLAKIAQHFNEQNIPTLGKSLQWSASTVQWLFK